MLPSSADAFLGKEGGGKHLDRDVPDDWKQIQDVLQQPGKEVRDWILGEEGEGHHRDRDVPLQQEVLVKEVRLARIVVRSWNLGEEGEGNHRDRDVPLQQEDEGGGSIANTRLLLAIMHDLVEDLGAEGCKVIVPCFLDSAAD